MIDGLRVLAVVPARSGSKGIPNKNMRQLAGTSLIGWTGRTLARVPAIDRRVISTDSADYAREAERHGLEAPFLRPRELSGDTAGAIDTLQHALREMEARVGELFDVVLIVEPTSPFRLPSDIELILRRLVSTGADSVVAVSALPTKSHPHKVHTLSHGRLGFYEDAGRSIVARQQLQELYYRNGVCYALTRRCLVEQRTVFGAHCEAEITTHPVINIDEPWELEWAEFQLGRGAFRLE